MVVIQRGLVAGWITCLVKAHVNKSMKSGFKNVHRVMIGDHVMVDD